MMDGINGRAPHACLSRNFTVYPSLFILGSQVRRRPPPHTAVSSSCPFRQVRPVMSFDVESRSSNTVVIHMGEALDFRNADTFKDTFAEYVDDGQRNFILDF